MDELDTSFLFEIELWTFTNCQPYQQSWMTALLAVLRYAPLVLTFLMFFAGLRYKELYLLVFGVGLTLSSLTNWLLNELIERAPRVATCPPLSGAAIAWQVQQVGFFVVFSLGYMALYRPRTKLWHVWALTFFYTLTVVGSCMLNYHFPDAIVSGAALGTALALCYQSFLYLVVVPAFPRLLRNSLVRYMAYQDTLCYGEAAPLHVIMLENLDAAFPPAERSLDRRAVREFLARQAY